LMDVLEQVPAYPGGATSKPQMSLRNVLTIIRARWWVACYVFAGVVVLTIVGTLLWPAQYAGLASVVVDASPDPVSNATGQVSAALEEYVTTQADVIASERVAQRVVKVLKLDEDPGLKERWRKKNHAEGDISVWLAGYVLKKLAVTQSNSTAKNPGNVIDIEVRWPNAKLAADLANAFAQVAIETNIELKVQQAKQYGDWFVRRSRELHADLQVKQKLLSDFERSNGITATDEKLDVENARLAELSTALVAIQGERQDSQSRQRQVGGGTDYESLPEVLQSPVIGALKNELSEAEAKQSDVAAQLGRNHPDYQAAAAAVKNLRERIAQESAKIANSLDATAHVNVRRESELRTALEEQKKRVLELKHEHDEASILEGDVAAVQSSLDAVNQRLAQSNLESQTQQTNMVLLTSAAIPIEPASPKFLLNLVLGIFLGVCFGIGAVLLLEARDPRIRNDAELLTILGVPLLGKIGPISTRSKDVKKPKLLPNRGLSRI
jgi:succinoglycan biosynthesis transport protein ExoP